MNRRGQLPRVAAGIVAGVLAAVTASVALAQGGPPQATLTSVTATGTDSIEVQGTVNPNGSSTTYAVHYGTTPALGRSTPTSGPMTPPPGSSGAVAVQAMLGGLSAGTTYYVQLVATNSAGAGASAVISAKTEGTPSTPGSGTKPPGPSSPGRTYARDVLKARVLAGRSETLSGVSCVSRSLCYALGTFNGGTFLERWNGRSWTRVAGHHGAAPLGGISCTSRSFCLTVGGTGSRTLAQRWNGRSLSIVGTVSPAGPGEDLLNSVSCVSARDCWAVGATHAAENTPSSALIEHWNGHRFTLASAPSVLSYLLSISCAGARDCWAVGSLNVTEHFDGSRWRLVRLPAAFNVNQPPALSCRATTECWIVGQGKASPPRGPSMVALHLVRRSWRRITIPYGPREGSNFIFGVDCASSTNCWAVGQRMRGFRTVASAPLAEQWNGSAWQLANVTGKPGRNSYFNGVSCASTSRCVVVGTTARGGPGSSPVVAVSEPGR
ncbi:MAG TPA: hypothetical protein VKV21_03320 [Solirubrobacteraceae bacterium]|nr:hypothetical protein [Solirubrobacteraceae bacterium]